MIVPACSILLGIYILIETIAQLDAMHRERPCRVLKYVLAGVTGLWLLWIGIIGQSYPMALVSGSAIALFIWPNTWTRVETLLDDLQRGLRL